VRLRQLELASGVKLDEIYLIGSGGRALEAKLHRKFSEYRTTGEWFNNPSTVYAHVRSEYDGVDVDPTLLDPVNPPA
jgi:hypothetical protein